MNKENMIFKLIEMLISVDNGSTIKPTFDHPLIGKPVIVRSRDSGVHVGLLESIDNQTVILSESRRMWRWWCKTEMSLSGVSRNGINQSKSKIAGVIDSPHTIMGCCEVIGFGSDNAYLTVKLAEVYNEQS